MVRNKQKKIFIDRDSVVIDSLSIVPSSVKVDGVEKFKVLPFESMIVFDSIVYDSILVNYKVYPISLSQQRGFRKEEDYLFDNSNIKNAFKFSLSKTTQNEIVDFGEIESAGSLSRGVTVGNNQDLALTSSFNLQLSGKVTDDIQILASVTDQNLPIQPEGNTQQLQDFDQVYIQLFNQKSSLTGGDYFINNNDDYFLHYNKRARGALFETNFLNKDSNGVKIELAGAISKGKYARNIIQGVEGNQGPYKLRGNDNERFIIVLAGTEQVFIDGKLMVRGEDFDYVINYNSSEIIFTPNQLITKDKRITVEFQYSDKNYVRSLLESKVEFQSNKWNSFIHFYSEQDHQNQPLQQDLTDDNKLLLASVGNNISQAITTKIDSVGFAESQIRYLKKDSLGYEVYVYSQDENLAHYQLNFSDLGSGNGNYIQGGFSAFGKVYTWVKPDTVAGQIIKKGNYEPVVILVAPKRKMVVSGGWNRLFGSNSEFAVEMSLSNFDENTFSSIGNSNNVGLASVVSYSKKPIKNKKSFFHDVRVELSDENYKFIERYRNAEFTRDWNVQGYLVKEKEVYAAAEMGILLPNYGAFSYSLNAFLTEKYYQGIKQQLDINMKKKDVFFTNKTSLLFSDGNQNSTFFRTYSIAETRIAKMYLGVNHELENNQVSKNNDSLFANSKFYNDWEIYLKNADSANSNVYIFGGQRLDNDPIFGELRRSAIANKTGVKYQLLKNKRNRIGGSVTYRELKINDTNLGLTPEQTFLNRLDFQVNILKGLIKSNAFYEVGSGLELKKEYVYVPVNAGQGTYAWIDYNGDSVQQIEEFEIAKFIDQANFIRTFIPSDDYVKVLTNQWSQSIDVNLTNIKLRRFKWLTKLSNFTSVLMNQKNGEEIAFQKGINPFLIDDNSNISFSRNFQNTLFLNRSGYKYGVNYTIQDVEENVLSSNGSDRKLNKVNRLQMRYRMGDITSKLKLENARASFFSEYLTTKDYSIEENSITPSVLFQLKTQTSIELTYSFQEKRNIGSMEFASVDIIGIEFQHANSNKITMSGKMNYHQLNYVGEENSPVEYQMLNGLKKGDNYTWEISFSSRIAKNMDFNVYYTGRKSPNNRVIHAGNMQVRAFF